MAANRRGNAVSEGSRGQAQGSGRIAIAELIVRMCHDALSHLVWRESRQRLTKGFHASFDCAKRASYLAE